MGIPVEITSRQQSMLNAIIRLYIATARPVASGELMRRTRPAVSPATIRNDMHALDEAGYLEQPHTSAGRVPTDKAYRFFVDYLLGDSDFMLRERALFNRVFDASAEDEFLEEFTRAVARMCRTFAAVRMDSEKKFYETGFSEVLAEPEFQESAYTRQFGKLIDMVGNADMLHLLEDDQAEMYIGQENPMREARGYTVVVSRWKHPKGFEGSLTLVGPRRMRYPRAVALLRYLDSLDSL